MSGERQSMNNRMTQVTRSFKKTFGSLLRLPRTAITSSIDVDSRSDVATRASYPPSSTSTVPVVRVNYVQDTMNTSTETNPMRYGSVGSLRPENPSMDMSTNTQSPMSLLQGAQNVYMTRPTITMANSVQNVFGTDGDEQKKLRTLAALCEKLLPRAQFAEYDAAAPAPRNPCTENTRKAVLDTLRAWASDNMATKVYWLNGMAGTGKTTIAYSFSEILDESGSLGGTFFSSHLRVDTSNVRCIIPTISLQLARYLPSLSHLVLDVAEANPDCSSWRIGKQFLNFIVRPLTAAYRDTKEVMVIPVIVLDALDECSDQSLVAELLSVILKHSKSLPVKFFITSRPEIGLKESFDKSWVHSNFILHEVEKEVVKADIKLYIQTCLINGLSRHGWPPEAELEGLVNMAGTLFIYAATVCKYISQRGSLSMPQRLSDVVNFTSDMSGAIQPLDVLYERILDVAYDSTSPRERLDISTVIEAIVYAYNPLSMTAISVLLQMSIERVEAALSSLHSLIYIPSSQYPVKHVSILHASFHDFISNQILSSKYYLNPCASHEHLALHCLHLMEKEWSQKESVSYLEERKCEDICESLAYACSSWAFHFTHSDNKIECAELKHFFETHLLQWMDCLSILGKLATAMHSLQQLKKWANTQKLLVMLITDAEQFLKEKFSFIKNNSLEGCPSALTWLPENSHIRKMYGNRMYCPWKFCIARREWSPCEAILQHSDSVNSAIFSADGMHIVTASADLSAKIWNTTTGECEAELIGHSGSVNFAVFSPNGMYVASVSDDCTVHIWNAVTGECEAKLIGHTDAIKSAVFSPDGMHIVSASEDCTARIWNVTAGKCEAELRGHQDWVNCAFYSPDGLHIVSASYDKTIQVWNAAKGKCKSKLKGHSNAVISAVFSPDGMHILSASHDCTARIWNTATGECKAELKGHSDRINSAVFSPDGIHIVSASHDQTARIWNAATGECETELKGHVERVRSAVFSPDNMHIVSASNDCTMRIWNSTTGKCEAELKGHQDWVNSAVFSPDGMHIVSVSHDNSAQIWDTGIGECTGDLKGHSDWVNCVTFSSDGMHILSASDDCTARIWNTVTGQCKAELKGHSDWVNYAVFSPDDIYVVSASKDCTAKIWNTVTGECKVELKGHSGAVKYAVFSPDNIHVVSASEDCTARIWNVTTGECEAELKGHLCSIKSVAFSPNGLYFVSASEDCTARIWNVVTRKCEAELKGHLDWVNYAFYSPDNLHIVSASYDKTICVWNAATGECEAELKGHTAAVTSATFSPDGMHIISASSDQIVRVWNIATGQCEREITGTYSLSLNSPTDNKSQLSVLSTIPYCLSSNSSHGIQFSPQLSLLDICGDTIFHIETLQKIHIPAPFQKPSSVSFHLSKICLGYPSGEVFLLEFKC